MCQALSGSKLFDTLKVFYLKNCLKKSVDDKKIMQNYPACKELNLKVKSTYFGEYWSSLVLGTELTNSCRDGRSCFDSPSLDRNFLRDFGSVEQVCTACLFMRFCLFLFCICPYGLTWRGLFFSKRITSFGFSFRLFTNFFSCQPT